MVFGAYLGELGVSGEIGSAGSGDLGGMSFEELGELAIEFPLGGGGFGEVTDETVAVGGKFDEGAICKGEFHAGDIAGDAAITVTEVIFGGVGDQSADGGGRVSRDGQPKTVETEGLVERTQRHPRLYAHQSTAQVDFFDMVEARG